MSRSPQAPLVSFVAPCYDEAPNVATFFDAMARTFDEAGIDLELVFIDDGSTDGTFDVIEAVARANDYDHVRVTGMQFSRNFGKESAIYAGLQLAKGDLVGIIDADCQQPPEDALAMVRRLLEDPSIDCVAAYQRQRYEKGVKAKLHSSFYVVLSKLSGMDVLENASDFRVFRRKVADAVLSLSESARFSKGIFAWVGFVTEPYPYTPRDRHAGQSKFSFFKLVRYAFQGIVSFSVRPLQLATFLGTIMFLLAIGYLVAILIRVMVVGIETPGYVTTIGVMLLIGGIQLLMLGIIGEYLAATYMQGKRRPIYIERRRIESDDGARAADLEAGAGDPGVLPDVADVLPGQGEAR